MELWHPHIYSPRPVHLTPHSIRNEQTNYLLLKTLAWFISSDLEFKTRLANVMLYCICYSITRTYCDSHECLSRDYCSNETRIQFTNWFNIYLNISKLLELYDIKKLFSCNTFIERRFSCLQGHPCTAHSWRTSQPIQDQIWYEEIFLNVCVGD